MPSGQHKNPHIVGFKDGTAKFYYQPTEAGHHILQTLYNGIPVPNGTYGFLIHSNKPGAVRACGPGLIGGMSDILTTFSVITKDAGPGKILLSLDLCEQSNLYLTGFSFQLLHVFCVLFLLINPVEI